jgi:hypothetical protein
VNLFLSDKGAAGFEEQNNGVIYSIYSRKFLYHENNIIGTRASLFREFISALKNYNPSEIPKFKIIINIIIITIFFLVLLLSHR